MDNFEKHIIENRAVFDEHKADRAKMWQKINAEIGAPEPKVIPLWKNPKLRIAASILLIIGLSLFFGNAISSYQNGLENNSMANKELQDVDFYYQGIVANQIQLVKQNSELSEADKTEFLLLIDELDEEYAELKLEMQKNVNNERVMEAIIQNYKQRIELIEHLLNRINETKLKNDTNGYIL